MNTVYRTYKCQCTVVDLSSHQRPGYSTAIAACPVYEPSSRDAPPGIKSVIDRSRYRTRSTTVPVSPFCARPHQRVDVYWRDTPPPAQDHPPTVTNIIVAGPTNFFQNFLDLQTSFLLVLLVRRLP